MRYTQQQEEEFKRFMDGLPGKSDEDLSKTCNQYIWLSAYANNNPRSNYHRMADALIDESRRRGKPEIYKQAYEEVKAELS